jgi:hypothetical protein
MGVAFLVSFITGFLKFTFLMLMFGLVDLVHRLALMSDIHDWAGLALSFFCCSPDFKLCMDHVDDKKILTGAPLSPGCEV